MDGLYLIEFYVNKLRLQTPAGGKVAAEDKRLTVNIDFGKFSSSLIINEDEFSQDILQDDISDDENAAREPAHAREAEDDEENYEECTITEKTFKSGVSILFYHNPAGLKQTFKIFPLEISVWTDDETEKIACVGIAKIIWDTQFIEMVGKMPPTKSDVKPLNLEISQCLRSEITGSIIGQITFCVRLSCLGNIIMTSFKKAEDGDGFLFRNRVAKSSTVCTKYGVNPKPPEPPSFGHIDEMWEDMDVSKIIQRQMKSTGPMYSSGGQMRQLDKSNRDMTIPCGNRSCKLSELLQATSGGKEPRPASGQQGKDDCKAGNPDDCCCNCKYLGYPLDKDALPPFSEKQKFIVCEVCGGVSYDGKTCKDKADKADKTDKPQCSGPCNQNADPPSGDPAIQRMLYEGLTRMLSNARTGDHKKYCPDFKHKSSCPIGGSCCQ